jgi:hypothetical protein
MSDKFSKYAAKEDKFSKYKAPEQEQYPQNEEPEQGFLNKLPRNIAAGAASGLPGLANLPYSIAKMLPGQRRQDSDEDALLKAIGDNPQEINPERIPHFTEQNYSKILGIKGTPTLGDKAIQTATEFALPILGAGKLAAKGIKSIAEHLPAVTYKGLANEVSTARDVAKQKYDKLYKSLFENAEQKGLTKIDKPDLNLELIQKNSLPKYHEALKQFMSKPTIENAHKAQSDLGKLERSMEKSNAINPLTSTQHKTYKAVIEAKDKIKESMFQGHPELADKYKSITHGYKSDVIPYSTNKALNQFKSGELGEKKLIQRLRNNDAFMLNKGTEHPGFKVNKLIHGKLPKYGLNALLALAGLSAGAKLLG